MERHKHFEYGLLEGMRKLVTLKGREVALAQGNVVVGKSWVQEKGKWKAREPEKEDETMI